MSIRVKLILTYTILVLISAGVLFFTGVAMVAGFFMESAKIVSEESKLDKVIYEVVDLLAEVKQAEDYEPDKLVDSEYVEELTQNLSFLNGGLVVRYKDNVMNYSGLPADDEFYQNLVKVHSSDKSSHDEISEDDFTFNYSGSEYAYFDYGFNVEGDEVLYFFVIDVSGFNDLGSKGGQHFFKVILTVLIIIMTPLLFILTSDIIRPLRKLENGVNNIKEGNLDFKLESKKKNEIGKVIKYFDVMRMELKKSIDRQVQYEDNRKELISSISHDLKTPITSIKGHVEGIMDGVANTPEKLDKYLNVIYKKSEDMDQLIDDLFLFSKLDLDRVPFEIREVPIIGLINEVVGEMKLEWENDTQKINLNINDESIKKVSLDIDQQQMKRVLINLIQNSMKYMDKENKEINITVNNNKDYLQVIIADNGMGIEEQHLDHIFDRFYRVDESRNTSTGGSGLGLAITKQIIEQHQGSIFATSVLGQGTKMILEQKKSTNELNIKKVGDILE